MKVDGATSCVAGIVTSTGIGSIALLGSVSFLTLHKMNNDTPKTNAIIHKAGDLAFARQAWSMMCEHARELERENARLREALTDLHAIADAAYGGADHEAQAEFDSWMQRNRFLLPNKANNP